MATKHRFSFSSDSSSDRFDLENYNQDSIGRRRRHAVYVPRPPVLLAGNCSRVSPSDLKTSPSKVRENGNDDSLGEFLYEHGGSSPGRSPCPLGEDTSICPDFRMQRELPRVSLEEERWKLRSLSWLQEPSPAKSPGGRDILSTVSSSDESAPLPLRQSKVGLCTRLKFQLDVRVAGDETWAIQEGSLVIGIDPACTAVGTATRRADEFRFRNGDVYVVCRLFADLWALCAKISFEWTPSVERRGMMSRTSTDLAFLPLCAVTLAANYSAFIERCSAQLRAPYWTPQYPGNGLPVVPPERSHSLTASKQLLGMDPASFEFPRIFRETQYHIALRGDRADSVPLDSAVRQLFADVGGQRTPVSGFRRSMSLKRIWRDSRDSDSTTSDDTATASERTAYRLPTFLRRSVSVQGRDSRARWRRSKSASFSSATDHLRRLMNRSN